MLLSSWDEPGSESDDGLRHLSEEERQYWQRYLTLFQRVDAQQPEKGIRTLLSRSLKLSEKLGISYSQALAQVYQEAVLRTERRIVLLSQCQHPKPLSTGFERESETDLKR